VDLVLEGGDGAIFGGLDYISIERRQRLLEFA